jgi:copper oxidase (laccase) domain-containing protein
MLQRSATARHQKAGSFGSLLRCQDMSSSTIQTLEYDAESRALTVTFVTGRIYRYYKVEPEVAEAFRIAASKGRFFNQRIRDHYRFDELAA